MRFLHNHPGFWLRDDAAAALDRLEADHGEFTVTSAGRTVAEQQALIDRWFQGGVYNRPPYLYEPARPPETSGHVRDGGVAVDIAEHERFASVCGPYGFVRPFSWDIVHFEYRPNGSSGGGGGSAPELIGDIVDEIERLSKVVGGTVKRAERGESISQRIDKLIDLVEWLTVVIGGTYERGKNGESISQRIDQIRKDVRR